MPPHASGMPSSTSGIEKRADRAATRRSHTAGQHEAAADAPALHLGDGDGPHLVHRPGHPPAAVGVVAGRARTGALPPNDDTSAPAENARPWPETTTTFSSSCSSNHRAAASISCSVCDDSGFSFSGRASVELAPRRRLTRTSIVSKSIGGT